jgi:hypothetical protein
VENDSNPWAVAGFVLSFVSGPIGLIVSIVGLRHSPKHRGLAVAGAALGFLWTFIGVVWLLSAMTADSVPDGDQYEARPDGTIVTVAPEVVRAEQSSAPEATVAQVKAVAAKPASLKGATFVVAGHIQEADDTSAVADIHPDDEHASTSAKVVLRGALLSDVYEDDQFLATVTVTGATAQGLPVLTVSDIETD